MKETRMDKITPYAKALVAFLAPGIGTLAYALSKASEAGTRVTAAEWVLVVGACFGTGALVYSVPNKDPKGRHQDDSVQPPNRRIRRRGEAGESALGVALTVLVVVVIVILLLRLL